MKQLSTRCKVLGEWIFRRLGEGGGTEWVIKYLRGKKLSTGS